jgi:membrane associated rhomboid family serine protease
MNPRRLRESPGALRPSSGVLAVLGVMAVIWLVVTLLHGPNFILLHLALIPRRALGPEPWQLVTSAFVHLRLGALVSTALALWLFASPIQQQLGRGRLWQILGLSTLVGSLAVAGVGRLLTPDTVYSGAGPASMASIAAFGLAYRDRPISFFGLQQMRATTCAVLFLGIAAVFQLMASDWAGLAGSAAGAGVGALLASSGVDDAMSAPSRLRERWRRWRIRRRYRVIPGGRDSRSYLN